jgi:hypothetical protein
MISCEVTDTPGSWSLDAAGPSALLYNHGPAWICVLTQTGADWDQAPMLRPGICMRLAVCSDRISAVTCGSAVDKTATLEVVVEA